jgi:excisionase family DNA binding protein
VSGQVPVASEPRRAFFTPDSLAAYLSLSGRTIRDLLRHGVIPSYKIGGARRIDPADVDHYLAEHRQEQAA